MTSGPLDERFDICDACGSRPATVGRPHRELIGASRSIRRADFTAAQIIGLFTLSILPRDTPARSDGVLVASHSTAPLLPFVSPGAEAGSEARS